MFNRSLSRDNDGLFYAEVAAVENDMISSSGASTDSSFTNDPNPHSQDPYRRSSAGGTSTTPDSFHSAPKHPPDLITLPDFASILPDAATITSSESAVSLFYIV